MCCTVAARSTSPDIARARRRDTIIRPGSVPPHPRGGRALAAGVVLGVMWAVMRAVNRSLVRVRGGSMRPTLAPGQLLLTRRVRDITALAPGRVVVVEDPLADGHLVVKRLVHVTPAATGATGPAAGLVQVTVLGDAPAASTDSRQWGPLPARAVRRVVVARWPSLSRTGLRRHTDRRATTSSSGSSSPTSPAARRP